MTSFLVAVEGAPTTKCQLERYQAESEPQREDAYIPVCQPDGSFAQVQCHQATGYCWCVTADGKPVAGSSLKGEQPECEGSAGSDGGYITETTTTPSQAYIHINIQTVSCPFFFSSTSVACQPLGCGHFVLMFPLFVAVVVVAVVLLCCLTFSLYFSYSLDIARGRVWFGCSGFSLCTCCLFILSIPAREPLVHTCVAVLLFVCHLFYAVRGL